MESHHSKSKKSISEKPGFPSGCQDYPACENKYRLIFERSFDIYFACDLAGKIIDISPSVEQRAGYKPDELIGQKLYSICHDQNDRKNLMRNLLKENHISDFELQLVKKNGKISDTSINATLLFDKNGKAVGLEGVIRDISLRKELIKKEKALLDQLEKANSQLIQKEKYLKSINELAKSIQKHNTIEQIVWEISNLVIKELDLVDCIIYLFDNDRKNLVQTAAMGPKQSEDQKIKDPIIIALGEGLVGNVALTGEPELIDDTSKDSRYILDDDYRYSELAVPIIYNNEILGVIDSEHPDKNFYNKTHLENLQTISGLVSARIKNIINKRKLDKAQEKLVKLSTAVQQSPNFIMITDLKGVIEYVNPAFENLTGYSREECINKTPNLLNSGQQSRGFYKEMWKTIRKGEKWTKEVINRKKNGETYWALESISPVKDLNGKVTHYVSMQAEIGQLKELQSELIKAKNTAEKANSSKSLFLATMSHEIRTPMNGIIGMSEILNSVLTTEEQKEHLELIEDSANNLLTIINDILDFSKIEAGQLLLEQISFNLEKELKNILKFLRIKANTKKLKLSGHIDKDVPENIKGDSTRLRQIIINLVNNAIKFTDKGEVKIIVSLLEINKTNIKLKFDVIDTGIGIKENVQEKLFKAFSQADSSTTRVYGGTGLGLSIAKQLSNLMGGEIGVSRNKEKGSTFWFTAQFEICDGKIEECSNTGESDTHQDNIDRKLRILLAEDNLTNQKIAVYNLTKRGHDVEVVVNGKLAVEKFKEQSFDLIFMDVQMPEMNGLDATREIRKLEKSSNSESIQIIALTANAMQEDKNQCLKAGMNGYISKPFKQEELERVLIINQTKVIE
ncbi:MAG: PAS domain S-box protein [Bacteroidetes bacterium]|jgi:PAS domain S-box-containing protein|nr:PAS domain S-box protein [Bacteroidota bacterium]MBT4400405.1 PAS domain S-box protein [Bacteroidota bacterium]MBT4412381.1 PAS domain S-box protein [Bacteroidota bacterium]MBT5424925.1 PAS domain S-box protein [Bacteroidota bacterium]MBT7466510.1 PAS domain S-box protein [Bacteroidota bacterium]